MSRPCRRSSPAARGINSAAPLRGRQFLGMRHGMNILLLGSGGREHALAWKIAASTLVEKLWCAPGNAGIAREAECVALDVADHAAVIDFCRTNAVDFVVVGPETPLAAGIVDDLTAAGIKAFGPSKLAAQLEGSKGFTKDLCAEFGIPTSAYRGQGRWPGGRQGRRGRQDRERGGSGDHHDVRRHVRCGRRRGGDRGIS